MGSPMLYRVWVVCCFTGHTEVRIVNSLLEADEIEDIFKDFYWVRVVTEPAPLAYLKQSASERKALARLSIVA